MCVIMRNVCVLVCLLCCVWMRVGRKMCVTVNVSVCVCMSLFVCVFDAEWVSECGCVNKDVFCVNSCEWFTSFLFLSICLYNLYVCVCVCLSVCVYLFEWRSVVVNSVWIGVLVSEGCVCVNRNPLNALLCLCVCVSLWVCLYEDVCVCLKTCGLVSV